LFRTFLWTAGYMKPYRRHLAALAFLSLAEIALRVLLPWPTKAVVDYALGSQAAPSWMQTASKERLLLVVCLVGLLIQVAHQLVMMLHTRLQAFAGQRMICDLRQHLFSHLQGLALNHHARMPKGDSVYRLDSDARCVENLVFGVLFPFTSSAVTLVVMFSILLAVHVQLAVISISIVPLIYLWLKLSTRRIAPSADHSKKSESRMAERLFESFAAIRLVKSFAREHFEQQRFAGASEEAMAANIRLGRQESTFVAVVGMLTICGSSLVLAVGALAVLRGHISVGTLLVVIAYLAFVYGPLSAIANTSNSVQRALASARRVRETLETEAETLDSGVCVRPGSLSGEVRFEDVSFAYENGETVLQNVSFVSRPGETIALVGPSGAGKSTLASLIPRLHEVSSGRVLIDGKDASTFTLRSLRESIAVVLQDVILMSGSVMANIRYGDLAATDEQVYRAAEAANAHEFIRMLPDGYATELREDGAGLSGGQRQRLSIARAFLKNAPILILDEPTAALDTVSEKLVLNALRGLRTGRTTFVIAHRLSTIREADKILVMEKGRLVAQGTHRELIRTSPLYQQLCAQMRDDDHDSDQDGAARLVLSEEFA
jgi:ABC-type multidrug transport system fused ATPase/permease subunit